MFDFNLGSSGESGSSSGGLRLSVSAPVVIVLCLWRAEQLFDALTLEQGMLLRVIILLGFAGMKQRIINYVGQLEDKLWISFVIVTWVVNTVATWCVTVSKHQAVEVPSFQVCCHGWPTWELHWRDRPQTALQGQAGPWTHPSQSKAPSAQRSQTLGYTSWPENKKNKRYIHYYLGKHGGKLMFTWSLVLT